MKFGFYLAPFHNHKENPTLALSRDLELIQFLDDLGYDYAWVSENYSADMEIIASPEVFITRAAARTERIKLGVGVSRVPTDPPLFEIALASQISPAAASTAGTHGLGLLSLGATIPGGFSALATNWEIYERKARENNRVADRSIWSLAGPMHLAETKNQALENVRYGIAEWVTHLRETAGLTIVPGDEDPAESMVESGLAVIGTPDDATAQIRRLEEASGGFGTFLHMAHNWADLPQTKTSYELFARYVAPVFNETNP
ncbi:MAG: LLM class flavin-dependent oxidoreductase [Gammaproteobacteria bacterium]|jgi:alkanesulfonate monooxygenase SsuD/methylene tetrahydromethanopterin reductase-like flavin-dependent oxidoreductase (luciferase family)|nr:LLM class flavin-dependent oxidoreductase [Gammaproteobacteria bacterium]MBT4494912.1 LLM class flavin-dependent oxidoreductase [Gammaproteobacteria bacterium]MBT7369084.1 LLM class flavin-dependent oxidoreductase [Gammaproteobacteria bacterium]